MTDRAPSGNFRIIPYSKELGKRRRGFDCGIEALNDYLLSRASQDLRKRASVLFVALPSDENGIAGFYTLTMYSVDVRLVPQSMKKSLPRYPQIPAILLGRLAVDRRFHGQRLGERLLVEAMRRALSNDIAWWAMIVHAKKEARSFYRRYGFLSLQDSPDHLFVPYLTIRQALNQEGA